MKIAALLAIAASTALAVTARKHHDNETKSWGCTIESESQCDGQNWSMSTCCKDPSYECRWDDFGQNVKRCQKKRWHSALKTVEEDQTSDDSVESADSAELLDSVYDESVDSTDDSADYAPGNVQAKSLPKVAAVWEACTNGQQCSGGSVCVRHSQYYSQCKPYTLGQDELCGQNDGTNVWFYDHCPAGQKCKSLGTDSRCKSSKRHHHLKGHEKTTAVWEACTNGQRCSGGSVCVRHSQYHSQCKPYTLGQGELCGQNDGTNVWYYDHCPGGQKCQPLGSDFRCK